MYSILFIGERHILSLKTQCDGTSSGCEWTGELRSLKEHLKSCDFIFLPCPNECKKGGEVHQLLRIDMKRHVKRECPRRQYRCPYCKASGEYQERTTTHLETRPMMKIPCPNARCNTSVIRCSISSHRQVCMHEKISCKYANIGCQDKVPRKDLKKHEGDSQQHLQLAIDTIHQLKTTVFKQDATIAQLQSNWKRPANYTVTNFYHLKASDELFYSPLFYTSPGGYKMCIDVEANGNGDGRDTHISVYAFLMCGENDNNLPWPFTGTVTFMLLNQLENKNHHSKSTTFPSDHIASQQVVNQERAISGYGIPCYISHSDLSYNKAKNRQYLRNDCLYFRITVNAESTTTPWLVM